MKRKVTIALATLFMSVCVAYGQSVRKVTQDPAGTACAVGSSPVLVYDSPPADLTLYHCVSDVYAAAAAAGNTNAATICTGDTTYLSGEGSCNDLDSAYQVTDADLTTIAALSCTQSQCIVRGVSAWECGVCGGGGGASALGDLSDVTLGTPATGEVLRYGASSWEDSALGFSDLTGTATDAQIPNDITVDQATLALTANTATTATSATTATTASSATTADALAADGANCAAGTYPLGVDAAGAVQGCTVDGTGTDTLDNLADNVIADLGNVSATTPSTGQVLEWNGSAWAPAVDDGGSGSSTIAGLDDTVITSAAVDELLEWNGTDWVNTSRIDPAEVSAVFYLQEWTDSGAGTTGDPYLLTATGWDQVKGGHVKVDVGVYQIAHGAQLELTTGTWLDCEPGSVFKLPAAQRNTNAAMFKSPYNATDLRISGCTFDSGADVTSLNTCATSGTATVNVGTCSGGGRDGLACACDPATNGTCYLARRFPTFDANGIHDGYDTGPNLGRFQICSGTCVGGDSAGNACGVDGDCYGTCSGGDRDGLECSSASTFNYQDDTTNTPLDCPGGTCAGTGTCGSTGSCVFSNADLEGGTFYLDFGDASTAQLGQVEVELVGNRFGATRRTTELSQGDGRHLAFWTGTLDTVIADNVFEISNAHIVFQGTNASDVDWIHRRLKILDNTFDDGDYSNVPCGKLQKAIVTNSTPADSGQARIYDLEVARNQFFNNDVALQVYGQVIEGFFFHHNHGVGEYFDEFVLLQNPTTFNHRNVHYTDNTCDNRGFTWLGAQGCEIDLSNVENGSAVGNTWFSRGSSPITIANSSNVLIANNVYDGQYLFSTGTTLVEASNNTNVTIADNQAVNVASVLSISGTNTGVVLRDNQLSTTNLGLSVPVSVADVAGTCADCFAFDNVLTGETGSEGAWTNDKTFWSAHRGNEHRAAGDLSNPAFEVSDAIALTADNGNQATIASSTLATADTALVIPGNPPPQGAQLLRTFDDDNTFWQLPVISADVYKGALAPTSNSEPVVGQGLTNADLAQDFDLPAQADSSLDSAAYSGIGGDTRQHDFQFSGLGTDQTGRLELVYQYDGVNCGATNGDNDATLYWCDTASCTPSTSAIVLTGDDVFDMQPPQPATNNDYFTARSAEFTGVDTSNLAVRIEYDEDTSGSPGVRCRFEVASIRWSEASFAIVETFDGTPTSRPYIPPPASPSTGDLLEWNGSAWSATAPAARRWCLDHRQLDPTTSTDALYFAPDAGVTLTDVRCLLDSGGATSVDVTIEECNANGGSCASIATGTCGSSSTTTTLSPTDTSIDANDVLRLNVDAVTGSGGALNLRLCGTL